MTAPAYPGTSATQKITDGPPLCHDSQAIQPSDDAHELALMQRIKAGDFDTRQQLVACNLLHVLRSHKHYAHSGTKIFDLLKAGDKGLVHALDHFEPKSRGRFSTYAATCIRQHIELVLNPQSAPSACTDLPLDGSPAMRLTMLPDTCPN
ncbi:MAG: hypothetical protein M0P59_11125 [Gallionella sp.]|jgi:DNA-directed RNA polymerase sigma subunit (sigma70/sigma32)|nr:hypothetical protein [Gallionella sp.]MCK9354695.1 hypothetical protein [Gallionella sp.]